MSPWKRAALGGLLGALLVLMIHPKTSPFYGTSLWRIGNSRFLSQSGFALANVQKIPQPANVMEAAYWVQAATEIDRNKPGLRSDDIKKLLVLLEQCANLQPDNAYWPQAQALFSARLGDLAAAKRYWLAAATKLKWDDLQNARLEILVRGLQVEEGSPLAWQYAYAYTERTTTFAQMVYGLGRTLLSDVSLEKPADLDLRFATLQNGKLLRDGSKSITAGEFGFSLIEMASFPPTLKRIPSQKKLLLARGYFVNQLRTVGDIDQADFAQSTFDSNEAWSALVQYRDARSEARDWSIFAIASATLPGSLVAISLVGVVLAFVGFCIERFAWLQNLLRSPIAPLIGVVMAILVYAGTELPLPAIWVVLSMSFFVFEAPHLRKTEPEELGPLFGFTLLVLGIALVLILGFFIAGLTAPGLQLFPEIGVPKEYGDGSTLLLAIAGILLGMVLVMGPAWGMVLKFPPQRVAGYALRHFGMGIFMWAMILSVVAGPIAYQLDLATRARLEKIAFNEPTFYLIQ